MKIWSKVILLFALVVGAGFIEESLASSALGCVCVLQWNASPSPGIAGYAVYYGISGTSLLNRVNAGQALSVNLTGLAPATTYFFYVVVYDAYGDESPPSNIASYTTPPITSLQLSQPNPGVMNIQFSVPPGAPCEVEYTTNLTSPDWTVLTNAVADSGGFVEVTDFMNGPQRFYRGVIASEIAPQLSATLGFSSVLQWNRSPSPGTTGYDVYYGVAGAAITNQIDVGSSLSTTITGLLPSTAYFFYVVSYNAAGDQSAPSSAVLYTTLPMTPLQISATNGIVNIHFQIAPGSACQVQYTTTLDPPAWTPLTNVVADSDGLVTVTDFVNGPQRFYRGAIGAGIPPILETVLPTPILSYTLQWDSGLDLGAVGYVVSYAISGSSVTNQIDAGQGLSTIITGLLPSTTYIFSVSSINVLGILSIPLQVVTYTTPPMSPLEIGKLSNGAMQIEFLAQPGAPCHVEYTTSLNPPAWTVLTNTVASTNGMVIVTDPPSNSGARFYRGAIP